MNILEFAKINGFNLNPIKTVLLKSFYGIKLDKNNHCIDVCNQIKSEIIESGLTEYEFQEWLYKHKRTNIKQDNLDLNGYKNLYLDFKRRSGKSMIADLITKYEAYKMGNKNGLFLRMATSEDEIKHSSFIQEKINNVKIKNSSYFNVNSIRNYDFVLFENFQVRMINKFGVLNNLFDIKSSGKFIITDDLEIDNKFKEMKLSSKDTLYYKLYSSLSNDMFETSFYKKIGMFGNQNDFYDDLYPKVFIYERETLI